MKTTPHPQQTAKLVGKCGNNCNFGMGRDLILNNAMCVCVHRVKKMEKYTSNVEVAVKQSHARNLPEPAPAPCSSSQPEPARGFPAPEAAANLIWAPLS